MAVEYIRVPLDRVAVIIGSAGKTKKEIEKETSTKITIDSNSGEVSIENKGDVLKAYKALEVVRAIARGFSPQHALELLREGFSLEVIDIGQYAGKSSNAAEQKRGRVIGSEGRTREKIEDETGCYVSVYGKTISVIGKYDDVSKAKRAVEMLLGGAAHNTVERELKKSGKEKFEL